MSQVRPATDLTVRQHERLACDLPARITLDQTPGSAVRLARSAPAVGGVMQGRVVDVSRGGVGLALPLYVPPRTPLRLVLELPGEDKAEGCELSCDLTVRRAQMSSRMPTYYIGTAFAQLSDEQQRSLSVLLARLGGRAEGRERASA